MIRVNYVATHALQGQIVRDHTVTETAVGIGVWDMNHGQSEFERRQRG